MGNSQDDKPDIAESPIYLRSCTSAHQGRCGSFGRQTTPSLNGLRPMSEPWPYFEQRTVPTEYVAPPAKQMSKRQHRRLQWKIAVVYDVPPWIVGSHDKTIRNRIHWAASRVIGKPRRKREWKPKVLEP